MQKSGSSTEEPKEPKENYFKKRAEKVSHFL